MEKCPFLHQNHGLTPLEKCQFFNFWTCCFYSLQRRFLVLEYRNKHFLGLYWLKEKVGKIAIFAPKPWVNHFGKMSIFWTFWTSCFYSLESRVFVLEYRKTHFPGQYCTKEKVGKMAIVAPKPWVNLFGKMSIFRLFELVVFIV